MADSSGGSSSTPPGNSDRGGANSSLDDQLSPSKRRAGSGKNELDGRPTDSGKPLQGWQLREQLKQQHISTHPQRTFRSGTKATGGSGGVLRNGSSSGGLGTTLHSLSRANHTLDPSLPPAFRAAFSKPYRKQKDDADDFMSLDSVHSGKNSIVTGTPTTANNDSDGSIGSESFDGHDSFASLGEDSDDDEAYRESKNQLRKQEIEGQDKTSHRNGIPGMAGGAGSKRGSDYRFKKVAKGVHGTPLGFIPE
jgi:hypothetical protein